MQRNLFFNTFCNFNNLVTYFQQIKAIYFEERKAIISVYLRQFPIVLQTFYLINFTIFHNSLTKVNNIILENLFYFEQIPTFIYIWFISIGFFVIYLFQLIYFNNSGVTCETLKRVIIYNQNDFFLNFKSFNKKFTSDSEFFRSISYLLLNVNKIFGFIIYTYLLAIEIRVFHLFYMTKMFSTSVGYFKYAIFQINMTFFIQAAINIIDICVLASCFGIVSNWIFYRKIGQVSAFIGSIVPNLFKPFHLNRFLWFNIEYLQFIADSNRVYGRALFYYNIISYLSNAAIMMFLLWDNKASTLFRLMAASSAFDQILIIFIFHLMAAQMTIKFHRPVKQMRNVYLYSKFLVRLKVRLKLASYLERFHLDSDKQYGLSYGQWQLITFQTYGKVSIR